FIVGVTGLLRLPDVYCRMHATTKCDTLGAGLILFGLALHMGLSAATAKLLLLVVFIWITNPTAAHVIARAAYHSNAKVSEDTLMLDETGEVQRDD
ncbi:MAG: monovalent cation/H(+) antiporter subunit G, partial [Firmicutes bacterium]|nr:monovalent cation/H(+) antiporter subunit G [Bacillota bacterium]